MQRLRIRQLLDTPARYADQTVTVCGWLRSVRVMKQMAFLTLNDGSAFSDLQVVVPFGIAGWDEISAQNVGAALCVCGMIELTPERGQPLELHAESVTIEGTSTADYPLQKKRHSVEFLRGLAHLRPRTNLFRAVFRLRSAASVAIHDFFQSRGFVYVHTPIITASDCEGAGEMFRVTVSRPKHKTETDEFFGRAAHLTVSGQLNVEPFCMAFGDVYTFGPTFRAEQSNTVRHAAEFWMIEPEIAFAGLAENMDLAEDMLKHIIRAVRESCADEMVFFDQFVQPGLLKRLDKIEQADFARITYTEAVAILEKAKCDFTFPVRQGADLQTEHERHLTEIHFEKPVFITNWPKEIKAFYMRQDEGGKTVAAMDLLVPGVGELIGGSAREERLDVLSARISEMGLDPADYNWYLDLRRYGGAKHAGFGLGFERLLMYLSGVANIRDVIPYPRTVGSAEF